MNYRISGDTIQTDCGNFPMPAEYMPRKQLEQYLDRLKREAMDRWLAGAPPLELNQHG